MHRQKMEEADSLKLRLGIPVASTVCRAPDVNLTLRCVKRSHNSNGISTDRLLFDSNLKATGGSRRMVNGMVFASVGKS